MRTHTILSAGLVAGLCLFAIQPSGCLTPEGDLDVPATVSELNLTAADLTDLAAVAESQGKAGTAKALQDTAVALQNAAVALEGGGTGDAWTALDFALTQLEALAASEGDDDLMLAVVAAKIIVRRIREHAPGG